MELLELLVGLQIGRPGKEERVQQSRAPERGRLVSRPRGADPGVLSAPGHRLESRGAASQLGGRPPPPCHPDFANHPNNSLHPGATSLLGEGSFKLVASEHNKLKTRQSCATAPVGTSGFMSPSYLLLSNESSAACFHFEAAGQIGSHWSHS